MTLKCIAGIERPDAGRIVLNGETLFDSDRHIDLLWGIWTLAFNLGTTRYTDRFMDAYGRELIDPDLLRCVAAMEMIGDY